MKHFFKQLLLFSLPFWVLLAWLITNPMDKKWVYNSIQKDCRTGNWIYRRLNEEKTPVDIAFLGTSQTMCNVNDALLEEKLRTRSGLDLHVANFGLARPGRNSHYLLAKEVLETKAPRYLVVEVTYEEPGNSHFHFTNLANTSEWLFPEMWLNQNYLGDLGKGLEIRWRHFREKLLRIERKYDEPIKSPLHSFLIVPEDHVADPAQMERSKNSKLKNTFRKVPDGFFSGMVYRAEHHFPKEYLRKIVQLAAERGTKLVFLWQPSFGLPEKEPLEAGWYRSMAPLWIPPDSVFGNPGLYMDPDHLNMAGAARLTDWLTEKVAGWVK